jgi:hypothetical protein
MDLIRQFNTILDILKSNERDISPLANFIDRLGTDKDIEAFFQYIQKKTAISDNEKKTGEIQTKRRQFDKVSLFFRQKIS